MFFLESFFFTGKFFKTVAPIMSLKNLIPLQMLNVLNYNTYIAMNRYSTFKLRTKFPISSLSKPAL